LLALHEKDCIESVNGNSQDEFSDSCSVPSNTPDIACELDIACDIAQDDVRKFMMTNVDQYLNF
jgi:hypothetical protein